MRESKEMPRYLKVSTTMHKDVGDHTAQLWLNGKTPQKVYFPEQVGGISARDCDCIGVSRDFPERLKVAKELINRKTDSNTNLDEREVLKKRQDDIERYKEVLRRSPLKGQVLKDSVETHSPTHLVKLQRNVDNKCRAYVEHGGTINPEVHDSRTLQKFQDFHISEAGTPALTRCLKLPQKQTAIYDCIRNETRVIKPPDLIVNAYSPYKDKLDCSYSFS
jgi:hypothetical protein